jgi:hypothetical protein
MLLGIDHVIVAVPDLEGASAELERAVGLSVGGGGRHEAHGTHNRLAWLGDSYLELMGVFDAHLAAQSWWGQHALAVIDAGGGPMGVALATDHLAADVARLRGLGSPILDPEPGERVRPDGDIVRWQIGRLPAVDPDLGLAFLIEHDTAAAEWRPADRAARAAEDQPLGTPARLLRVELPVADLRAAMNRLLRELGLQFRPALAGAGARDASIGGHVLRLLPAGAGLPGRPTVVLRGGSEPRDVEVLGVRWLGVPAAG